jgi:hypothetical protein
MKRVEKKIKRTYKIYGRSKADKENLDKVTERLKAICGYT